MAKLLLGQPILRKWVSQPGDEFEIKLGYKHIHLIQIDAEMDEDED